MIIRVWVDVHDVRCHRGPFRVGETATWLLNRDDRTAMLTDVLGGNIGGPVVYTRGHSPDDTPQVTGVVTVIQAVHDHSSGQGRGTITRVEVADGKPRNDKAWGTPLRGYVVTLAVDRDRPGTGPTEAHSTATATPRGAASTPAAREEDPLVAGGVGGWLARIIDVVDRGGRQLTTIWTLAALAAVALSWLCSWLAALTGNPMFVDSSIEFSSDGISFTHPDTQALIDYLPVGIPLLVGASLIYSFTFGGSVYVIITQANGHEATSWDGLGFAARRLFRLTFRQLEDYIVVLAAIYYLWLVPGLYLLAIFGLVYPAALVVERGGTWRALGLTHRHPGVSAARLCIGAVLTAAYLYACQLLTDLIVMYYSPAASLGPISRAIFEAIFLIFAGVLFIAANVVTYAQLRARQDPTMSTASLADQLHG